MKINTFNTLLNKAPKVYKPVASFIALQESEANLANIRFLQDTATNLFPKAIFSRSIADLSEMSFLELSESALVYYAPGLLGNKVFRKIFSKNLPENLQNKVVNSTQELIKQGLNDKDLKKVTSIKAAIAMAGMCIPLAEYCLNYVKNLLTLKVFKQADFNNIANLNKDKKESEEIQKKVKDSAKKHIALAGFAYAASLGTAVVLALKGDKSKLLQNVSELVLTPGKKLFSKNKKAASFVDKYFSLDFVNKGGKLALGRGQLTSCVLIGGVGYFGAAKDRGKQNFLEVLTRYPLVGFYVITGSELLEKGFKKLLHKKGMFKNLINDKLEVPKLSQLPEIAERLAERNKSNIDDEFKALLKGKGVITGVPFIFSLAVMGFFIAGMTRFSTQRRYEKEMQKLHTPYPSFTSKGINTDTFKTFLAK